MTASCVPASVLEVLTLQTMQPAWFGSWDFDVAYPGVHSSYAWYGYYVSWLHGVCPMPVFASANTGGDTFLTGAGVVDDGSFRIDHPFLSDARCADLGSPNAQGICPPAPFLDQFLCAWPEDLDRALLRCGDEPPSPNVGRFRLGARIVFGVADGSDGWVWVPGEGPVPVDPQPFREAFAATPVAVTTYADARARDQWLGQVEAALDEEGTSWRRTDDLSMALDTDELLLVTPSDEQDAVAWLERNRDRLDAGRAAPVALFLERDGKAIHQIRNW